MLSLGKLPSSLVPMMSWAWGRAKGRVFPASWGRRSELWLMLLLMLRGIVLARIDTNKTDWTRWHFADREFDSYTNGGILAHLSHGNLISSLWVMVGPRNW